MASVYEKYGGFKTVSRVVMTFYDLVLDSDQIGDYFENVDMARQIDHQTKFIASLMGGPASISDERLRVVHAPLGLSHADFDEMRSLLSEAMSRHGIVDDDIRIVIGAVEARRHLVVTASAA